MQLSENRTATITALEAELKRQEEAFKKVNSELDDRNKVIQNFHARISALEEDIMERQQEVDCLKKDLEEKTNQIQDLQADAEEFHKIATETRTLYDAEKRKSERHKMSIMHRNAKIVELETALEKSRAKSMNLEARLEAAHNEVKSKNIEAQSPHCRLRGPPSPINTNMNSFLVHGKAANADLSPKKASSLSQLKMSPSTSSSEQLLTLSPAQANALGAPSPESSNKSIDQLQHDINKSRKHIAKLEQDQLKACRIIQSMLDKQKKNESKIKELQNSLHRKDSQIKELTEQLSKIDNESGNGASESAIVSVPDRATARNTNPTQHMNPLGDNEVKFNDILKRKISTLK